MRKFTLISFTVCLSCICAAINAANVPMVAGDKPSLTRTQEDTWNLMIGKWYGTLPIENGGIRKEIIERSPQGSYKIVFRKYAKDGSFEERIENGQWGVSGPIYFTIFRGHIEGKNFLPANSGDPYNYDAYKIIQLTTELFEYESFDPIQRFTLKKVPLDFDFPK